MRRGELWTVAGGGAYAGKPRPAVILQDDAFVGTASLTICAVTSDPTEAPLFRLLLEPSVENGLRKRCSLMVDKITTVPRRRLGYRIARLGEEDMVRLDRAVLVLLGLAGKVGD